MKYPTIDATPMIRSAALIVALFFSSPSAFAENCRKADGAPPGGIGVQPPPGAKSARRAQKARLQLRLNARAGTPGSSTWEMAAS